MSLSEKVVIDPATVLTFTSQSGHAGSDPNEQLNFVTFLSITNQSKERNVAYKVKTTAPKNYVVKPNQGIIETTSTVQVEITYIPSSSNSISDNKFLVQIAYTDLKASEAYALGKFWEETPKQSVKSHKLKVALKQESSADADAIKVTPVPSPVTPAPAPAQQVQSTENSVSMSALGDASKEIFESTVQTHPKPVEVVQLNHEQPQEVAAVAEKQSQNLQQEISSGLQTKLAQSEYEKAPDESINESVAESKPSDTSQLQQQNTQLSQPVRSSEIDQKPSAQASQPAEAQVKALGLHDNPFKQQTNNVAQQESSAQIPEIQKRIKVLRDQLHKEEFARNESKAKINQFMKKLQIQDGQGASINQLSSSTPGSSSVSPATQQKWEGTDMQATKKTQTFPFSHLIIVAIIFMLLGAYLASGPSAAEPVIAE